MAADEGRGSGFNGAGVELDVWGTALWAEEEVEREDMAVAVWADGTGVVVAVKTVVETGPERKAAAVCKQ